MKRPIEISTVAVFLVLAALASIAMFLLNGGGGMNGTLPPGGNLPSGSPGPQQIQGIFRGVMIGTQALGLVASLLAAFGLWRLRKWGYWLALILGVLKIISGIPLFLNRAMPVSPVTFGQLAVGLIMLILLLLKDSREAIFPEPR